MLLPFAYTYDANGNMLINSTPTMYADSRQVYSIL